MRESDPWHKRWWTGDPRVLDLTDLLVSLAGVAIDEGGSSSTNTTPHRWILLKPD